MTDEIGGVAGARAAATTAIAKAAGHQIDAGKAEVEATAGTEEGADLAAKTAIGKEEVEATETDAMMIGIAAELWRDATAETETVAEAQIALIVGAIAETSAEIAVTVGTRDKMTVVEMTAMVVMTEMGAATIARGTSATETVVKAVGGTVVADAERGNVVEGVMTTRVDSPKRRLKRKNANRKAARAPTTTR